MTAGPPSLGDVEGIATYDMDLKFLPVSPGNNELSITFWGKFDALTLIKIN